MKTATGQPTVGKPSEETLPLSRTTLDMNLRRKAGGKLHGRDRWVGEGEPDLWKPLSQRLLTTAKVNFCLLT